MVRRTQLSVRDPETSVNDFLGIIAPFRNFVSLFTGAYGAVLLTRKASLQEAQLSQRGGATLRVVGNFAKSLRITQRHSKLHL